MKNAFIGDIVKIKYTCSHRHNNNDIGIVSGIDNSLIRVIVLDKSEDNISNEEQLRHLELIERKGNITSRYDLVVGKEYWFDSECVSYGVYKGRCGIDNQQITFLPIHNTRYCVINNHIQFELYYGGGFMEKDYY